MLSDINYLNKNNNDNVGNIGIDVSTNTCHRQNTI